MKIYITNGEYYNKYFEEKTGNKGCPFNEAMMYGDAHPQVLSLNFIKLRAKQFSFVTPESYARKMKPIISLPSKCKHADEIYLYFGLDTFCQINLLTVLAFLEQNGFSNDLYLNIIDDYSMKTIKESIKFKLGVYDNLYQNVVVKKEKPEDNFGVIDKHAIDLYFDYLNPDGRLVRLVKENITKGDGEILEILMDNSKEYGISDSMAMDLIDMVKDNI